MILITGAGGKTGRAIVQALATQNAATRAMVRRQEQVSELVALGASEAIIGDIAVPTDLAKVCAGVTQLYLICPNMHPDEAGLAKRVITAAQSARVERIVYHSVLHPQTEKMPHHWHKLRVEEQLFESGIPFTIVQPAAYMQNVLAGWSAMIESGIYRVPYATTTRLGMVDLADVAKAAATILTTDEHTYAAYELCGPQVLDQTQIADKLSNHLRKPVIAETISHSAWSLKAKKAGLSDLQIEWLIKMFRYYEQFGFWGNPNALTKLINRSPNTFEMFLQQNT